MRQHVVRREDVAAPRTKASYLGPVLEGHVTLSDLPSSRTTRHARRVCCGALQPL